MTTLPRPQIADVSFVTAHLAVVGDLNIDDRSRALRQVAEQHTALSAWREAHRLDAVRLVRQVRPAERTRR